MFEGMLERVLTEYFGEYIDGLDKSHLSVGLLSGQVSLRDLTLRTSALDELRLPLDVRAGFLRSLLIQVRCRAGRFHTQSAISLNI
jgi:vacuolar protein sorting-associated protein 13A/C